MKMTAGPAPGRSAASNERGTALIPLLAILLALSLLAAQWMAGAHADALVAARRKNERESSYAAEAVLGLSLAALESQGDRLVPREALIVAPPPSFATALQRGRLRGWEYTWRAAFLPDTTDADGDSDTATVLYDRSFGYGRSPFPSAGFPVLQIDVTVARGEARRSLVAAAAPLCLDTSAPAAWTAGGGLVLDGPFRVSGGGHNGEGEATASSRRATAAVVTGGELSLLGGAAIEGSAVLGTGPLPDDISTALCPSCSPGTIESLPPPEVGAGPLRGMFFSRESYRGPLRGEGVLIVHNPRFLPAPYEASRLALEEGLLTEAYDPAYSHLDPDNKPALLEVPSDSFFRGLVVADSVGDIYAGVRVVGAVRTLGRAPLKVRAWEAVEVLYSAETLRRAGLGPFCLLLEAKVLPADESRLR